MVSFSNGQNQTIILSTDNYQFPDINGDEGDGFDKNWLQVNIEVIDNKKSWKNTDPFLLSYDWMEIAKWFSEIAKFKQPECDGLCFIEPNIAFQLIEFNIENDTIVFDIELRLECVPAFCKSLFKRNNLVKYRFCFASNQCEEISELCKKEYERFPERK